MMGMTETKDIAIRLEQLCREGSEVEIIRKAVGDLISKVESAIKELSD